MENTARWNESNGSLHQGSICGTKDEYTVISCDLCDFKHVIPIPDEKFLEDYYSTIFFRKRGNELFRKHENEYDWNKILYFEKYDYFKKHLKVNKPSLLDIGCSMGLFLKTGMEMEWDVFGIDPGIEEVKYAKNLGLTVENKFLSEKNYKEFGKFDVINMTDVIEHLRNPGKILDCIVEMINSDGLLSITSPNDFNPLQEMFQKQAKIESWWIAPPEHLNYFDLGSITKLLESKGLEVLETTVSFPLEFFLLMGDNYIGNKEIGSSIHNKRMNLEFHLLKSGNESLRRVLYRKFAELNIGREFTIIAKK